MKNDTLNRAELIDQISRETLLRQRTVAQVLDALTTDVTFALSKGRRVRIPGLGVFQMQSRAARTGRNPHTGEAVPIPPRTVPVFEPDDKLKNATAPGSLPQKGAVAAGD